MRVPKRKYLRDSKFLLEKRTSEKEKAGEIMLFDSDFADKLTEAPTALWGGYSFLLSATVSSS